MKRFIVQSGIFALFLIFCPAFFYATAASAPVAQETLTNFDKSLHDLRDERDALRQEVDDLKIEHRSVEDSLELKMKDLEDERGRVGVDLEEAQAKMATVESEKQDLLDRIEDMQIKLGRFEEATNVKDSVFMQAKEENQALKMSLSETESVLAKSADRIQKLQKTKEGLEAELKNSRERLERVLFDQDDDLSKLRNSREAAVLQIKNLEAKLKAAEVRLNAKGTVDAGAHKKNTDELKKITDEHKSLKEEKAVLEKKYEVLSAQAKKESHDASTEAGALKRKIEDLENKNKIAQQMLALAGEKLKYYETTIDDLKNKNGAGVKSAPLNVSKMVIEMADLKDELAALKELVERLKKDNAFLSKAYSSSLTQIRVLKKK